MNNVNDLNKVDANQNKSSGFSKLTQVLALCAILNIANPTEMKATNITDESLQNVEVVQNSNIISNIQRRTWVSLPNLYLQKVQNFVLNDDVMKDSGNLKYTEDFIVKQMQSNRWISKQNQLLFIRSAIYNKIMKKSLYNWDTWDWNDKRLDEYDDALEYIVDCWQKYKDWLLSYMNKRSADADRRSADADRRIANAKKRLQQLETEISKIKNDITRYSSQWLQYLNDLYTLCKNNSNYLSSNDLKEVKKIGYDFISLCKQNNINYKSKLSPEVRKFYGVE